MFNQFNIYSGGSALDDLLQLGLSDSNGSALPPAPSNPFADIFAASAASPNPMYQQQKPNYGGGYGGPMGQMGGGMQMGMQQQQPGQQFYQQQQPPMIQQPYGGGSNSNNMNNVFGSNNDQGERNNQS